MKRGQQTSAEQVVLKLRQIEVQTARGKSLALACKEAEISEQSYYLYGRLSRCKMVAVCAGLIGCKHLSGVTRRIGAPK